MLEYSNILFVYYLKSVIFCEILSQLCVKNLIQFDLKRRKTQWEPFAQFHLRALVYWMKDHYVDAKFNVLYLNIKYFFINDTFTKHEYYCDFVNYIGAK